MKTLAGHIENEVDFNVPTFIKWAGGKTQLLPQLVQFMPNNISRYEEPFLGSGAVFFLLKLNFDLEKVVLSDNTSELINCYQMVKDNVQNLLEHLVIHKENHSKEYYYKIRAKNPEVLTPVERASRFLYLNKTCFNGLYRLNSKGEFNVPIGSYINPNIVNKDDILYAHQLLQNVCIKERDFAEVLSDVQDSDFIYFDPPYHPLSSTAYFTSYTAKSFSLDDQIRLYEVFKSLDQRHCLLMQSNSDTEFIRNLYKDFRIEKVTARRAINSDASKRGPISEVLILNY
jgi:DNA adenine methylase